MAQSHIDGRRRIYVNTEPWETNVPMALIPAVTHFRRSFDDAHSEWGPSTQSFCYALLHGGSPHEPANAYSDYLTYINTKLGAPATQRFEYMLAKGTPPAILMGFYELYLRGTNIQSLIIFTELIEIGRANQKQLTLPYLDWAVAQTRHMIRDQANRIELWIKDVCDKRKYDASEEREERFFWRKWQAPMLLVMQPFWGMPYDPSKAWERMDAETSAITIELIAGQYALKLQGLLDNAAGDVAVESAKQSIPNVRNGTTDDAQPGTLPATPALKLRSNSKPKKPSGPESTKRSVIFGALQGNLEGLAYCRALDKRGLTTSSAWTAEGCPSSYAAAYRNGKWRKRIQDEKSRYKKKYKLASPAERER